MNFPLEVDLEGLLMKIPRPERSGWISVLCFCIVVQGIGGVALEDPDFRCWLHPDSCQETETNFEIENNYHIVYLDPHGKGKSKECLCHVDFLFNGKPVQHVYPAYEETCDSTHWLPDTWTTVEQMEAEDQAKHPEWKEKWPIAYMQVSVTTEYDPSNHRFSSVSMKMGEGKLRRHCESPEDKK
jgi:hypothetical protein